MSNNQRPEYQTLSNKPISCTFCGEYIRGQVVESYDPKTKKAEKMVKWNCSRCGNRVRQGKLAS